MFKNKIVSSIVSYLTNLKASYGIKKTTNPTSPASTSNISSNVNVRDYGATGNGQTDDTKAIQNAIDYASNHGGGTVSFPKATYIAKNIVQKPNTTLTFVTGTTLKFPKGSGGTDRMIIVGALDGSQLPTNTTNSSYVIVGNGLIIDASNVSSNSTINGIYVSGATNFTIDGVNGQNFVSGYLIEVIRSYGSKEVYPSNGKITNITNKNQRSWGGAIAIECASNLTIDTVNAQGGVGVDMESDEEVMGSGSVTFKNITIQNVTINNGDYAVNINPHRSIADTVTMHNLKATKASILYLYANTDAPQGKIQNVSIYDSTGDGGGVVANGFESPNDVVVNNLTVNNVTVQNYKENGFKVNGGTWNNDISQNNGLAGWQSTLQSPSNVTASFTNCQALNNNTSNAVNISGFLYNNHAKLYFYSSKSTGQLQWYGIWAPYTTVYIDSKSNFTGNKVWTIGPKDGASYDPIIVND